jgi:hypothetical protein
MNTTPAAASGTLARTRRTVTAVSVSAHITIRQASPAPTGAQKACRVDGGRRDLRAAARAGKQQRAARQRRPETQQVQPAAKRRWRSRRRGGHRKAGSCLRGLRPSPPAPSRTGSPPGPARGGQCPGAFGRVRIKNSGPYHCPRGYRAGTAAGVRSSALLLCVSCPRATSSHPKWSRDRFSRQPFK